jgi:hypothetical protein
MLDQTRFDARLQNQPLLRDMSAWQFVRSAAHASFDVVTHFHSQHLTFLLVSFIAIQVFAAPATAQSNSSQFFDLAKHAVDSATTIRVFKLQKALMADNPQLTISDIPEPLSEQRFDRDDHRLRSVVDVLSRKSSYDLEHMLSVRTRAQFGIIFTGPSGSNALLFSLPIARQSTAVTLRLVSQRPIDVGSSTAVLVDAAQVIIEIEQLLKEGTR